MRDAVEKFDGWFQRTFLVVRNHAELTRAVAQTQHSLAGMTVVYTPLLPRSMYDTDAMQCVYVTTKQVLARVGNARATIGR